MELAKNMILLEIETINELIKRNDNKNENLKLKKELLEVLFLIDLSEEYDISKNNIENILKMPGKNTGYSEYRIIDDCESDDPLNWIEAEFKNEKVRLYDNDIVIKLK
ncbi:hypothetical protein [Chryseobacterium hispalense]|uniref:hypothetical protein n=1 Tax=Chryseobacterium hispalense TaxID=1453492 RepID=UPI00391ACFC6